MPSPFIQLVFLIVLLCSQANADDVLPKSILGAYVKKSPVCFIDQGGSQCNGFVFDTIAIERKTKFTAYVGINTSGANGHGCSYHGIGRWKGDKLIVSAKPEYSEDICRIEIEFSNGSARFKELNEGCTVGGFCSYRGSLAKGDGFVKRKKRR